MGERAFLTSWRCQAVTAILDAEACCGLAWTVRLAEGEEEGDTSSAKMRRGCVALAQSSSHSMRSLDQASSLRLLLLLLLLRLRLLLLPRRVAAAPTRHATLPAQPWIS